MSKWLLPIALLFLLGLASGIGFSSSGPVMISGNGMSSSGSGMSSGTGQYTPWQEGAMEGLKIGFHMGQMYALAQQGQNISGFNAEVDNYNAWIQKNFGDDPVLHMSKTINAFGVPMTSQDYLEDSPILIGSEPRRPFNASSELGKFGKQQLFNEIPPGSQENAKEYAEAVAADMVLKNFLAA